MYRMGPGGWSDVPLAMAEQLRLAASVLFVSFALDSRHQRREQGLFVLFGFAAFGLMQRSFGYYLELILLTTLCSGFEPKAVVGDRVSCGCHDRTDVVRDGQSLSGGPVGKHEHGLA